MDKLLFEHPFSLWGSRSLLILGRTCRAVLFQLLFWMRGECWYSLHFWGACKVVPTCACSFNPQDSRAGVASPLFPFHRISWNTDSPSDSRNHALTLWHLLGKGPQAGSVQCTRPRGWLPRIWLPAQDTVATLCPGRFLRLPELFQKLHNYDSSLPGILSASKNRQPLKVNI